MARAAITGQQVRDLMTFHAVTVAPDDTVKEALDLLVANNVAALPVVDGANRCVGVISATDLLGLAQERGDDLVGVSLADRLGCARRALAARLRAVHAPGLSLVALDGIGVLKRGVFLDGDFVLVLDLEPGDLVGDGLLARVVGTAHDDLEALVVVEEAAVEFGLDGAGCGGAGEAGQADLLRDARVEFQHSGSRFRGKGDV